MSFAITQCSFLSLPLLTQHTVEVLSLLSDDVETDDAGPGENLKLRLKGIEEEEILPGFILCNAENLCHSGRTFDAQVGVLSPTTNTHALHSAPQAPNPGPWAKFGPWCNYTCSTT